MVARFCLTESRLQYGILLLAGLVARELIAPPSAKAQSRLAQSPPGAVLRLPAQSAAGLDAARERFHQFCAKCHGKDGKGTPGRSLLPDIPDFATASWQARRTDAQLLASILDGKGQGMPSFRGKIKEAQARELIACVRAFGPEKTRSQAQKQQQPAASNGLTDEFRCLQEQLDELKKQFQAQSHSSAGKEPLPAEDQAGAAERGARDVGSGTVCTEHGIVCYSCSSLPLLFSVFHVQQTGQEDDDFSDDTRRPRDSQETPQDGFSAEPTPAYFQQLIGWLGRFHSPVVHFPIALLTAAALAEMLRMVTGLPSLEVVSRYCLWFGALAAILAGVLGWCWAGFRLVDDYWVLATHRWLGTSTVLCTALVLLLCELSRRPALYRLRSCYRFCLLFVAGLALATGFFGGAAVFGLDHYAWPYRASVDLVGNDSLLAIYHLSTSLIT
jgi:mono/diheme cytochrome c family protein/uncharacterized membrane protein